MEGEAKTVRTDQKSIFFISLFFFLKIQNIRKSKTPIFERGSHKNFLGQVLTIFQTSPLTPVWNQCESVWSVWNHIQSCTLTTPIFQWHNTFFFKTVYFGQIEQHNLEYLSVYRYKTEIYRTTKKCWYMSKFWALLRWKCKQ